MGNRTLGDMSSSMPTLKLLAYENANKFCQELLSPHRNKSLDDFIHLCRDVKSPSVVGQATVSAPGKVTGRTRSRICFHYGRPGQAMGPVIGPEPGGGTGRDPSRHLTLAAAVTDSSPTGDNDGACLPSQLFGDRDLQFSVCPSPSWLQLSS